MLTALVENELISQFSKSICEAKKLIEDYGMIEYLKKNPEGLHDSSHTWALVILTKMNDLDSINKYYEGRKDNMFSREEALKKSLQYREDHTDNLIDVGNMAIEKAIKQGKFRIELDVTNLDEERIKRYYENLGYSIEIVQDMVGHTRRAYISWREDDKTIQNRKKHN